MGWMKVARSLAAVMAFATMSTLGTPQARTAELKVLTSVALTSALDALAPRLEQATGSKVAIGYGLNADLRKRILEGESADVVILSQAVMEELAKNERVAGDSLAKVAGPSVSVAVRAGAPKPDIGSVESFKEALLAAKSVVYADPAKGGASGVYFARVIDRLGIADQLKTKTVLVPGAQAADVVAKGEAEMGIAQASEIVPVAGAQLVGPFPGELNNTLVFTAGIGTGTRSPDAAKALIRFLTSKDEADFWRSKGFSPE